VVTFIRLIGTIEQAQSLPEFIVRLYKIAASAVASTLPAAQLAAASANRPSWNVAGQSRTCPAS